ncbi:DNA primase family protein [Micrococcus yunnanensis]|uniref:DNA primase family protein n=1 Tax=Micrococcus yunnanensis TaxID=566027 RepID=UPI0024AF05C1|nr:phage/plasmid primase, P4 family [Micrococcus yunnanensis]WHM16714.1 phage/plasmid primase, P4 family [Micrococcus yunnanensis]
MTSPLDMEDVDLSETTRQRPDYFHPDLYAEQPPAERPGEKHRGQLRIAHRLAEAHSGRLMYVNGLGWHVWDGQRWAPDETAAAERAVHDVLRSALAESHDGDRNLREDVRRCETAAGIRGVLDIAATLEGVRVAVDALDADPHLLNVANGTLDLRTRTLRPHDPADRLTRVCRGAWTAGEPDGLWADFLARVLPDDAERAYFQRVIGQAVFGAVREHLFPVLTGTGANGKGTAYTAIAHALGDYAAIIDPDLLMTSTRGPGGPEMMQLFGARLVIGSETEEGKPLDAALMKRLTGGDPITARHLYQAPVTWEPSHQFLYVTNHLPKVKGNDPAVWRRVRVLPFDVVIPPADRDPALPERLREAADAVVSWAVAGWWDYLDAGGMGEPDAVLSATDAYAAESDAVRRFVAEMCVSVPGASAGARELHTAWSVWAAADGADALSEKKFGAELDRLGYPATRTRAGMRRTGIGLAAATE